MSIWAVIPIKPLRMGKSRLANVLSDEERENLNKSLLIHTIKCTMEIREISETVVISCDPAALRLSRELGIRTIRENRCTSINKALRKATKALNSFQVDQLLILPADLPLITSWDISDMINNISEPPEIIIAPDRENKGTNALLINPPDILDYDFGDWSFKKHIEQAERKGIRTEIYNNRNIAFDLDTPDEIKILITDNILEKYLLPIK